MARQRKTLEEIEVKLTGGEPNFKGKEISNVEMAQALNWYSQNRDNKTAIKYTNEYFKRQKIKIDLSVINKQKPTFGFLCRLKTVGAIFTKKHEGKKEILNEDFLKRFIERNFDKNKIL